MLGIKSPFLSLTIQAGGKSIKLGRILCLILKKPLKVLKAIPITLIVRFFWHRLESTVRIILKLNFCNFMELTLCLISMTCLS